MFGIVVLMLAASTAFVILALRFYIIQVPVGNSPLPDAVRSQLNEYNATMNWMSRLNVSISVCA